MRDVTPVYEPGDGGYVNDMGGGFNFPIVASPADVVYTNTEQAISATKTFDAVQKFNEPIVLPKTSGEGIKVDTATPTFPWADLIGEVHAKGTGPTDPSWATYRGGIKAFQFTVNDEVWLAFHLPHDYVPGSDIHIHAHWSHIATTVTGGSVTWGFEVTYSKGHNQAAFAAPITTTITQNASTTQYQHMIAEVQLSAVLPSAAQIDSDSIEVDGMILVRAYLSANNLTVSGGGTPEPFLHLVDIHYQSTGIGTKNKAPNFWS